MLNLDCTWILEVCDMHIKTWIWTHQYWNITKNLISCYFLPFFSRHIHHNALGRNCTKLYGIERNCMELYGIVRNCTELYRIVRNCTELYGIVWNPEWGGLSKHSQSPNNGILKNNCSRQHVFPSELLKLPWQSPLLSNTRKYCPVELAQYGSVLG